MLNSREIQKGNTQKGVNFTILQALLEMKAKVHRVLDLPCGEGEFLSELRKIFPQAELSGQDLYAVPPKNLPIDFHKGPVTDWGPFQNKKFDLISCISGVMVFSHTELLFENAAKHLNSGGLFIVTNDNILSFRDRLSFLFFGRFKRFARFYKTHEGNWNLVLIQGLAKHFELNQFELLKVQYTSWRAEDLLTVPFALVLFPIQFLYDLIQKSDLSWRQRLQLFPFQSFYCRHYVMIARKK